MNELEREIELSEYLEQWVNSHYGEWSAFYYDVSRNRRNGIYLLKDGSSLMDLVITIHSHLEEIFAVPDNNSHLIPAQFASVSHLIGYLKWFKSYVDTFKPHIEKNITGGVIDNYILSGICEMVGQIDQVVDRCVKVYGSDNALPHPFQQLRGKLFNKDVDGFVELVSGILKGVPYLTRKKKFDEGHFQTMLQILLTVLGFEPNVEAVQSDGRVDMVIRLNDLTYIFEFKYTQGKRSQASVALQQIKDKKYANSYKLFSKEIIGVGVSFCEATKNINGMKHEVLYER